MFPILLSSLHSPLILFLLLSHLLSSSLSYPSLISLSFTLTFLLLSPPLTSCPLLLSYHLSLLFSPHHPLCPLLLSPPPFSSSPLPPPCPLLTAPPFWPLLLSPPPFSSSPLSSPKSSRSSVSSRTRVRSRRGNTRPSGTTCWRPRPRPTTRPCSRG